jgi:hypothetical protein
VALELLLALLEPAQDFLSLVRRESPIGQGLYDLELPLDAPATLMAMGKAMRSSLWLAGGSSLSSACRRSHGAGRPARRAIRRRL